MSEDPSFASKLKDALRKPFELLADAKSGCISKKSAMAHLLLCKCKAKQFNMERDDEQIKMLVDLIFHAADLNEDGKISLDEAFEAVSRLASNGFPADIGEISKEEQDCMLKMIQDYTDQLSLDSKTSGAHRLAQLKALAQVVFEALDTDHSGFLEAEEAIQAFLNFASTKADMTQCSPTPEIGEELIKMADKNGDGKINIDEFFRTALTYIIAVHSHRFSREVQDSGLFLDMPNLFDEYIDPMVAVMKYDLDDETAAVWLGLMPVVLYTQFKLVIEGYGLSVRGLNASIAAARS